MAEPEVYVCDVCGRVLDHHDRDGYIHTSSDLRAGVDHDPVPVPQEQAAVVVGRCDFCYADSPEWVIPAMEFEVVPGHRSAGDWAACGDCGALIDRDQWSALLRRAKVSWESRNGAMPSQVEQGLARMYRKLRKHMTGSLKPNPALAQQRALAAKYGKGWKTRPSP